MTECPIESSMQLSAVKTFGQASVRLNWKEQPPSESLTGKVAMTGVCK